ncbi:hypothetical protein CLOM_g23553 [Closterium sp. NIES-68]|nr:hypothetical protein CLOM_g23553 [Closterium sp. NIES-68]GJP83480.1 hypothetical protein CLOP_g13626 [Closterium sp. NIES-67]GJP84521.1 hypothetical protein CLOP_g14583 [Closterium sp. NIES-67]
MDLATAIAQRLDEIGYSLADANAPSLEAVDLLLNHTEQRIHFLDWAFTRILGSVHSNCDGHAASAEEIDDVEARVCHSAVLLGLAQGEGMDAARGLGGVPERAKWLLDVAQMVEDQERLWSRPPDHLSFDSFGPPSLAACLQSSSFPPLFSPDLLDRATAGAANSSVNSIEEADQRLVDLRERKQQIHDETILLAAQCVVDPLRDQSQQHTTAADANLTAAVRRYLSLANEVANKVDRDLLPWMQRNPPPRPIKLGPRASAVHRQHSAVLQILAGLQVVQETAPALHEAATVAAGTATPKVKEWWDAVAAVTAGTEATIHTLRSEIAALTQSQAQQHAK